MPITVNDFGNRNDFLASVANKTMKEPQKAGQTFLNKDTIDKTRLRRERRDKVLEAQFVVELQDAGLRLDIHPDGGATGFVGAVLPTDEILRVAAYENVGITELLVSGVNAAADLNPDPTGACQAISLTLEYAATDAYLFDE